MHCFPRVGSWELHLPRKGLALEHWVIRCHVHFSASPCIARLLYNWPPSCKTHELFVSRALHALWMHSLRYSPTERSMLFRSGFLISRMITAGELSCARIRFLNRNVALLRAKNTDYIVTDGATGSLCGFVRNWCQKCKNKNYFGSFYFSWPYVSVMHTSRLESNPRTWGPIPVKSHGVGMFPQKLRERIQLRQEYTTTLD